MLSIAGVEFLFCFRHGSRSLILRTWVRYSNCKLDGDLIFRGAELPKSLWNRKNILVLLDAPRGNHGDRMIHPLGNINFTIPGVAMQYSRKYTAVQPHRVGYPGATMSSCGSVPLPDKDHSLTTNLLEVVSEVEIGN